MEGMSLILSATYIYSDFYPPQETPETTSDKQRTTSDEMKANSSSL